MPTMDEVASCQETAAAITECENPHSGGEQPSQQHSSADVAPNMFIAPKPESTSISTPKKSPDKQATNERLKRSRERNRVHARKTRQRKKEQMLTLQTRADELKEEQVRLKQSINEKNTASILVGLFATAGEKDVSQQVEDPRVETLLRRPAEEIPDASKITELPALILPGQHNSKKVKAVDAQANQEDLPDDGIDYQLLGKDRAKCSPEELDRIRRERNRMHAKRTRDRKRLFMEEMSDMCKQLEEENNLLRIHLQKLDGGSPDTASSDSAGQTVTPADVSGTDYYVSEPGATSGGFSTNDHQSHVMMDQLKTLVEVAGSFENKSNPMNGIMSLSSVASSVATAVSASDSNNSSANASVNEEHDDSIGEGPSLKRRRLGAETGMSMGVPHSIAI